MADNKKTDKNIVKQTYKGGVERFVFENLPEYFSREETLKRFFTREIREVIMDGVLDDFYGSNTSGKHLNRNILKKQLSNLKHIEYPIFNRNKKNFKTQFTHYARNKKGKRMGEKIDLDKKPKEIKEMDIPPEDDIIKVMAPILLRRMKEEKRMNKCKICKKSFNSEYPTSRTCDGCNGHKKGKE